MTKTSSLALVLALFACEAPAMQAAPAARPPEPAPEKKPGQIEWTDAIVWRDWDSALAAAQAGNKSICVVMYADWCPRCKELAPEFARPDVIQAAANLVMVRQDQDAHAPWVTKYLGKYDNSVPRVFFLDPNGTVREDLNSGHPRYPYFYAPLVTDTLLANMRTASARR